MNLLKDMQTYFERRAHKEFGGSWQSDNHLMELIATDGRTAVIIRPEAAETTIANVILEIKSDNGVVKSRASTNLDKDLTSHE